MRGYLGVAMLLVACSEAPAGGAPRGAGGSSSAAASTSGPMACVPGVQVSCACPGGAFGAQACIANGSGYGACDCPIASSSSVAASSASSSSAVASSSAAASSSVSSSSAAASSSSSGGPPPPECTSAAQCPAPHSECNVATCIKGACGTGPAEQGTPCALNPTGGLCKASACVEFIPVVCTVAGIDYQLCDGVQQPDTNDTIGIYAGPDPTVLTASCTGSANEKHYCAPGTRCFVAWSNYPVGYGTCK